jgi:hypothetical protein
MESSVKEHQNTTFIAFRSKSQYLERIQLTTWHLTYKLSPEQQHQTMNRVKCLCGGMYAVDISYAWFVMDIQKLYRYTGTVFCRNCIRTALLREKEEEEKGGGDFSDGHWTAD